MPVPTLHSVSSHQARIHEGARLPRRTALSLRLSERKVLLFVGDLAAITAALLVVLAWRFRLPLEWETLIRHPLWFGLLAGLWSVTAPILDTYDLRRASRVSTGVAVGIGAAAAVSGIYLLIPYITPPLHTSRLTALSFVVLMLGLVAAVRAGYAGLLVQPTFRHRVIVVGAGWAGRTLLEAIRTRAATEYDFVGFVDDDPARQGAPIDGLSVIGTSDHLRRLVEAHAVSEVILAVTHRETLSAGLVAALIDCRERGVHITDMQGVYERLTGRVPVEHVGSNLHVVMPVDGDPTRVYPVLIKRAIDIVIGLCGCLVTLVLLPFIALAIRLEGPGPILYRQVRVGRGGRPFVLLKFRTMVPHAEPDGPQWAAEDDARVTRVGAVLRRLHLDELPQAVNLLRGEMAFIGPRPERPEFVATLERHIPFYRARHAVRPGVTGWAQVNYPYARSLEDALIKLQYDLYYIKHCSLFLDASIVVKTLRLVLGLQAG
ncbi:MAG: sugar transferase [Armatimonadetes bacterium]|nr:sugar transferase [Armatimonadota bacterium]